MRLALVALVLSLIACAPKDEGDTAECVAPGGCTAVLATVATGEAQVALLADGDGGAYAALLGRGTAGIYCPPAEVCHGELWRIDRDGNVTWKVRERKSVDAPLRIRGGVAYRTGDGRLEAISASGERLWRVETGDPTLSAAAWAGDVFVVGGGQARRVRAETGEVVWSVPFAAQYPAPPSPGPWSSRVLVSGVTGATIVTRALEYESGETAWEASLPGTLSAPGVVAREPEGVVKDRGPVMIVSDRLSLRAHDGSEVWGFDSLEGFRFVAPTPDGGWIALGPLVNNVTRFRANGTVLWSGPSAGPVVWLEVAPDGQVLLGQQDGVVRKVHADSGLVLWQYGGVDQVRAPAPPTIRSNGNVIFHGANTGEDSDTHLTTLTPAGQGLERWNAGARISSIALSDDGDVFIAVSDGRLYLRRAADL